MFERIGGTGRAVQNKLTASFWTCTVPWTLDNVFMNGEKLVQFRMSNAEAADLDARVADSIYTTRTAYIKAILEKGVGSMSDEVTETISRRKALKLFSAGNVDEAVETWQRAGLQSGQEKLADDVQSWAEWFFRAGKMTRRAESSFGGATCLSDVVRMANANMEGDRPRELSGETVIRIIQGGEFDDRTGECYPTGGWCGRGDSGLRYESPRHFRAVLNGVGDILPLVADTFAKIVFMTQQTTSNTARAISVERDLTDFKTVPVVAIPALDRPKRLVLEDSPILRANVPTRKVGEVTLARFGQIFGITEQALLGSPESVDFVRDMPRLIGQAIGRLESDIVFGALLDASNLADGTPPFDASRNNLSTPAGKPNGDRIGMAFSALASQETDEGGAADYEPAWIVTQPSDKWEASQAITDATPAGGAPVLECMSDARMGDAWFVGSDPAITPGVARFRLANGLHMFPDIVFRNEFHVDGLSIRVRFDGGAAFVDPTAIVKNAGS